MLIKSWKGKTLDRPLLCLIDTGSTYSWIKIKSLPPGVNGTTVTPVSSQTLAGKLESNQVISNVDVTFPEFHRQRTVHQRTFRLVNNHMRYDVIIGRDILKHCGFKVDFENDKVKVDFENDKVTWDDVNVPMRPFPKTSNEFATNLYLSLHEDKIDDPLDHNDEVFLLQETTEQAERIEQERQRAMHSEGYRSKNILSSKYEFVDADTVAQTQKHLTAKQQSELSKLLKKYSRLFSGGLGEYKDEKVHLIIDPKVKPSRCRPYTVPRNLMKVFKEELDRLLRIGVLEKCGRSEWIAGTFIIPKKDGRIRWISDFRALNKALKRQVYH
ncbi:retroviral aspartyl protease [Nitzschia inconspicua]|uniref:Retroviral aspartyl protease n=1 Tax=Nitzschia inconspicua TaxID=303405 RepID=A0A9K3Q8G4_9STRA|nr:retroviral aspartyl protease [Nitzschia inconspicua]